MAITTITVNGQEPGWNINATSDDLSTSGRLVSAASDKSITLRQLQIQHSATSVIKYSIASKESASASLVNVLEGMIIASTAAIAGTSRIDSTFINPLKLPQGHALFISADAKARTSIFVAGDFI